MKLLALLFLAASSLFAQDNKLGIQQFALCGACHGQQGEGTGTGPPLAGSEWVNGPAETLIRIQLRGLHGPISVKGVEYNYPAPMPPLAYQKDEEIAAVLTHIRSSFGNDSPAVTPAEVAALRSEVGQPMLYAPDIQPAKPASTGAPVSDKYANLSKPSPAPKWIVSILAILSTALLLLAIKKRS